MYKATGTGRHGFRILCFFFLFFFLRVQCNMSGHSYLSTGILRCARHIMDGLAWDKWSGACWERRKKYISTEQRRIKNKEKELEMS